MAKKGKSEEEKSYSPRDIVLAKVRGYPAWPGMVVDPETVPPSVSKERPQGKKSTFYCVRFFPVGDHAWIVPKDISRLQKHEIEAYISEPHKKSGDLLAGYKTALDPEKWEQERENERAEIEQYEAEAEVDQLESEADGDEDGEKKTKSKKRKRESETPAKSKKKETKKDISAKKKAATGGSRKKNGGKANAMVESEDEGGADADADAPRTKEESAPPTKKSKRDDEDVESALTGDPEAAKVKDWRHKLQKAFLNTKSTPKSEEMPELDKLFTTVEQYPNMTIQYLQFSKIGKVMRHINALTPDRVPRDDEFKFRDRAKVLVDKWHEILDSKKEKPAGANGTTTPKKKEPDSDSTKTEEAPKEESSENMQVDTAPVEAPAAAEKTNGMDVEEKPKEEPAAAGEADAPAVAADVSMSE